MMNNFSGHNDNVHGDEHLKPEITAGDILEVIAVNGADPCGVTAREWIKQLATSDALYHLLVIVAKGRDNPAFSGLIDAVKIEIEGFL